MKSIPILQLNPLASTALKMHKGLFKAVPNQVSMQMRKARGVNVKN